MVVYVPEKVYEELEAIRRSGATNMADISTVQRLAYENEMYHAVTWLEENEDEYMHGFFEGIEPAQQLSHAEAIVDEDGGLYDD